LGAAWASLPAGEAYASLINGTLVITIIWLILYWMHWRRIYIKI